MPQLQACFLTLLADYDFKANQRLSSLSPNFFDLASIFGAFLTLYHLEFIPENVLSFAGIMGLELPQAVLVCLLDQGDKQAADEFAKWEARGPPVEKRRPAFMAYAGQVAAATNQRSCFRTWKGYIGPGPTMIGKGDLVCVLFGCLVPVVLRKVGSGYVLVGVCFVLGLMDGEALSEGAEKGQRVMFNIY